MVAGPIRGADSDPSVAQQSSRDFVANRDCTAGERADKVEGMHGNSRPIERRRQNRARDGLAGNSLALPLESCRGCFAVALPVSGGEPTEMVEPPACSYFSDARIRPRPQQLATDSIEARFASHLARTPIAWRNRGVSCRAEVRAAARPRARRVLLGTESDRSSSIRGSARRSKQASGRYVTSP